MGKFFILVMMTILWIAISVSVPFQTATAQSKLKIVEIRDGVKTETEVMLPDTVHDARMLKGDMVRLISAVKEGSPLPGEFDMAVSRDSIKRVIIVTGDANEKDDRVIEEVRVFEYRNDSSDFRTVTRRPRLQSGVPVLPPPGERKIVRRLRSDRNNVIRLDDPTILTYKKKNLRNGREKITIIRERKASDLSIEGDQFVDPNGNIIRIDRREKIGELKIKDRDSRENKEMIELDLRK